MTGKPDDILDDLFLGCAFAAYVDLAIEEGRLPDSEATRRRAYRYYEEVLALKNGRPPRREPCNVPQASARMEPGQVALSD